MTFSIYQLKPRFQQLLRPLLGALAAARVTPNQVTLTTAALMVMYGAALAVWPDSKGLWIGLAGVLLVRMAGNAIDGLLAHHTGQKTPLGAMLNEVCDVLADFALYLPVAGIAGVDAKLAVVAAAGAALVEQAGVAALLAGSVRRFDGPMGKSDRAFVYGLIGLLAGCGASPVWINALLAVTCLLLVWTVFNRLKAAVAPQTP